MKHIEIELVEKEVLKDVFCDSCGKSCNTEYGFEYMELTANWGFSSNKDLERWEAQICEKCVDEKFSPIKFKKTNYITGSSM